MIASFSVTEKRGWDIFKRANYAPGGKMNNKIDFSEVFDGFKGLDLTSPIGSGRLSQLKNFRLLFDGSAIKREGFGLIASLDGEIRGATAYVDGGEDIILAVSGSSLYRVNTEGEISSAELLSTAEGNVDFFELRGELYLTDGVQIYRYTGGASALPCSPQPALYGKDWEANSNIVGVVNSPFNLLTPRIRIDYICDYEELNTLAVGIPIKSVDGVIINQAIKDIKKLGMSISSDKKRATFDSIYCGKGARITMYVTVDSSEYIDPSFNGFNRAAVFDCFDKSRVFLYGGGDGDVFRVSGVVSDEELALARSVYGEVDPLYFPKGEDCRFGGMNAISGFCRVGYRMLVFSKHRTWITSDLCDSEGTSRRGVALELVSHTLGCSSDKAFCVADELKPITVSRGGIFKWSFDNEFEEDAVVTRLSDNISEYLDDGFLKNAAVCYQRDGDEIWFANRASENGEVLVYDLRRGLWWLYDGIRVDRFIEWGAGAAFVSGSSLFLFDKARYTDRTAEGDREIEGVIESAGFEMSAPRQKKQICSISVTGCFDGGKVALDIDDGKSLASLELSGDQASPIHVGAELVEMRVSTGRTERAKFTLRASGVSRQRIYALEFRAMQ